MVDAGSVEERRPALDAVNLVTLREQHLGEVGSVLSGNTGNKGLLHNELTTDTFTKYCMLACDDEPRYQAYK